LAREANVYTFARLPSAPLGTGSAGLDRKAPWFQITEDPQAAATSVYVILRVVDNLKTILTPILPHTPVLTHRAQKLYEYLGYDGQLFGSAQGRLFGTQHVVEYQEEARHGGLRSQQALTYDHTGAIGTHSLRSVQASTKSELPPGGRRCAGRRPSSRSWMRA
jgi:hypothetical protein